MTAHDDSPSIRWAKLQLSRLIQERTGLAADTANTKPTGIVSILEIPAAEAALAAAQHDLSEYQRSDNHMHETVNAEGRKGLAISPLRAETLEQKRDKVAKRRRELAAITRAWLAQTEE